jgi:S1-C subfamily serine protease
VTLVDWVIVAFVLLLALRGYERGFIVGALSLVGFAVGALIGSRVGPLVLSDGSTSQYAPLFGLGGALLLGSLLGAGFERVGSRGVRVIRWVPGFRLFDGLLGAVLTAAIALGIVWIAGAALLQSLGSNALRRDIEQSTILRALDSNLPPSGPILGALEKIDPLPSITGPPADVSAPTDAILAAPGVTHAIASVVRITGQACGVGLEGSGWAAAPDVVVTNAHVVAGETNTLVQRGGIGAGLRTRLVLFDTHNDVAVLRVPGLGDPALPLASGPAAGTAAAILGFPEDGPFDAEPGRLGDTRLTATDDAYGNGPVLRQVTSLRGLVRPGNSGGPLVNAAGQVVGTVFATLTDDKTTGPGGLAVPNSVVSRELSNALRQQGTVSSGQCDG